MRIAENEIGVIKSAIWKYDHKAEIFLFGSRTDDNLKGGDIDILVISKVLEPIQTLEIKTEIFKHIEEQKIDIIIKNNYDDPFVNSVINQAIKIH